MDIETVAEQTAVETDWASVVITGLYATIIVITLVVIVWVIVSRIKREKREPKYEDRSK